MASSSRPLMASDYVSIERREEKLDAVRKELNLVINALPTQVHPTERELYLDAILDDLDDREDAPWTVWPQDVYVLALTAIKALGRNPVGSETLLTSEHFPILLHHSSLPCPSVFSASRRPPPLPTSAPAREALKVLANLLVLHAEARNLFASSGGAKAVGRALAGKNADNEDITLGNEDENTERLFLLGRLGFLVTLERPRAVGVMVDTEDVVDSLVNFFTSLSPTTPHHAALSELLKLSNNLIRFYPYSGPLLDTEQWDECFNLLLYPTICQFYAIPFIDISPPLSHAIHVLLAIPFTSRLLPTWHSVPIPSSPSQSPATPSPTSSMKTFLNKLSNMSSPSAIGRRASGDALSPPRQGQGKTESPSSSRRGSGSSSTSRPAVPVTSSHDPSALPARLIRIFDHFFDTYLPWPRKPDDPLPQGLAMDELLPPLLLLLTRAAAGSEPIRLYLKETLLPSSIDRSPAAGALESRKGTLGNILRLMGCAGHTQSRNTAGELMWAICKGDAADLCVEIGYGNAAGLLFQKGLSGPPPAKVEELPTDHSEATTTTNMNPSATTINVQPASPIASRHPRIDGPSALGGEPQAMRNPVTSLRGDIGNAADGLDSMTQEEKEREAERLFVLFERMEKNPVISMKSGADGEGEGKKISIKDLMRDKLAKGELEDENGYDRRHEAEEDERDEEEALRDLEAYKRRTGRK
ncbi:hypothetical protein I316_03074 [Kwoniella heveanensis BCC8398]|uniref:Uncharacterized protein n=1 Tax=Kwoniella heveanensis BCC8398 TaxID=1296120 RepID=A0A1B9GVH6_9TREE|nr:hypothetical protein I316_03074 [Kwoniella heveanensis BCC8398]